MIINVNGETRQIVAAMTVAEFLAKLSLEAERVTVEHNRVILTRADFAKVTLADGDNLEIIQFVGGG